MRGARNATLTRLDDIRSAIVIVTVKKSSMRHLLGDCTNFRLLSIRILFGRGRSHGGVAAVPEVLRIAPGLLILRVNRCVSLSV
jgi:hypothetical protein